MIIVRVVSIHLWKQSMKAISESYPLVQAVKATSESNVCQQPVKALSESYPWKQSVQAMCESTQWKLCVKANSESNLWKQLSRRTYESNLLKQHRREYHTARKQFEHSNTKILAPTPTELGPVSFNIDSLFHEEPVVPKAVLASYNSRGESSTLAKSFLWKQFVKAFCESNLWKLSVKVLHQWKQSVGHLYFDCQQYSHTCRHYCYFCFSWVW